MKEVIAILREERWRMVRQAAERLAVCEFAHQRVLGRGRGGGLRYLQWRPAQNTIAQVTGMSFIPKRMVSWLVQDEQVDALVELVLQTCRTDSIGDGKIFIMPAEGFSEIIQDAEATTLDEGGGIAASTQKRGTLQ